MSVYATQEQNRTGYYRGQWLPRQAAADYQKYKSDYCYR